MWLRVLQALMKEHEYWTQAPKLVVLVSGMRRYELSRYYAAWELPRPESYGCERPVSELL